MKKRYLSAISLLMAATMLLCTVLVSCGNNEKKTPSASDYIEKIFDKTFGSVSYEAKNTKTHVVWNSGPDVADSTFMIADINLYSGVSGESAVMIDGLVEADLYTFGNSVIAVSPLLGETPIGATMDDIQTLVNLYMPESSGDTSASGQGSAVGILGIISSFLKTNAESVSKLLQGYADVIVDSTEKATEEKVTANDEKIEVEVNFCCDSAKKIIKDIYDKAKKDTELKKLFEGFVRSSGASDEDVTDMMKEYSDFFSCDEKINELFDKMNEADFDFAVTVSSDALFNLKTFGVILTSGSDSFSFGFDIGDPDRVSVSVDIKDGANAQKFTLAFNTEKLENDVKYSCTLGVYTPAGSQNTEIYSLTVSSEGGYLLETALSGGPLSVAGKMYEENGVEVLTVSGVTFNGRTKELYITVSTEYGVDIPQAPSGFKRITALTVSEIKAIINNVKAHPVISELTGVLKGQMMPMEPGSDLFGEF